jgi:TAG lipase/steryl ester hydrolase/phospholipase A2/LPA acyltransferase
LPSNKITLLTRGSAASCSVPLVFSPAIILAKDHETGEEYPWNPSQQLWIDGSVDNDLPMTRLAEMFNVNHFIVSQVNPHVVPFLVGDNSVLSNDSSGAIDPAATMGPSWLNSMASFAKSEALHRMHVLTELGVFPNYLTKLRSVLSQKYAGDITILPEISYASFPQILSNPTPEFMITSMRAGERATWLHLDRIRNHCAIELALDNLTMELRTSIVFSSSQVDLRLQTLAPGQSSSSRRRPRHRSKTKSWCAEPGKGFQHSFEMTPNSMRQIRIDAPVRESEWTEAETTAHEDISDEDYDDEEYLSFESSRRRKSRGTEPPKSPTSTSNQYGSKSNVSPLDFESSPGPDSPVSTFHRPTPRQLFSHGSNPNTPRNSFLPFSSIHSGPAANAGVRWALSPTEERDNLDLTMTNSMMAEQPGAAIGVESQVDHVTGVPTPGLSSAFRAGAKSTTSLPLQMSGITDLMTRRKSNR